MLQELQSVQNKKRIQSIDLLRGIIMLIMALDHTRDFFHSDAFINDPLNPDTTTPILFFTRWITHLCAPTFVFLSGLSVWLQSRRKSKSELTLFLITRGFWLILVDLTIMTLALTADIHFNALILETLWSIGASMVVLGLMIWLPFNVIFIIGLLIFFGHNLLDFAEQNRKGIVPIWWSFLHSRAGIPLGGGVTLFVLYPFLSWTGLMLLGYCCGKLFTDVTPEHRKKILLSVGAAALILFVVLRWANVYGDPGPWSTQKNTMATFFSFMNVQKYPPSLLFLCATVAPGLIFLALIKNTSGRFAKIVIVYGRVPFFFFIVHFYILQAAHIIIFLLNGHSLAQGMKGAPRQLVKFIIPGEGYSLAVVYLVWIAIVIIMYPLCKKYDAYKTAHPEKKWLSYL